MDAQAGISLDAVSASNFTTTTGALTLEGGGGVTVTSTGGAMSLNGAGQTVTLAASTLDVNAEGITVDGTTVSIDGTDDSNLTVTGEGKDLDIAVSVCVVYKN